MNRDLKLDSLKGLLILLVVIGHISLSNFNLEKSETFKIFVQWFYFFHMPLFMAVSVLFVKNNYLWIIKRASLLLIPYLFWFFWAHKMLLFQNPLLFIADVLMGNWGSLNSTIWFLPAIFSLNVIFFFFEKAYIFLKVLLVLISLGIFVFADYIAKNHYNVPFGIDVAFYVLILALIIRKVYIVRESYVEKIRYSYLLTLIIFSSIILFLYEPVKTHTKWHGIIDFAQFSVATTFIGYVSFIVLNVAVFVLFLKLKNTKYLSSMGYYSLPIFLLHLIVSDKIHKYFTFDNNIINTAVLLLSILLSVLLPIVVSKSLMKISDKFKYVGMIK